MHTNDMIYRMNLGPKSNFYCRGARELGAATLAATGNLSMRYFGFYERGHLGVIYRQAMEIGKYPSTFLPLARQRSLGESSCGIN